MLSYLLCQSFHLAWIAFPYHQAWQEWLYGIVSFFEVLIQITLLKCRPAQFQKTSFSGVFNEYPVWSI